MSDIEQAVDTFIKIVYSCTVVSDAEATLSSPRSTKDGGEMVADIETVQCEGGG